MLVVSYVHLFKRGYHHDCVDVDALAAGTTYVDDNSCGVIFGILQLMLFVIVVFVRLVDSPSFVETCYIWLVSHMMPLLYSHYFDVTIVC